MLTREENELLCRVGPGTPMGDVFRRYWLPAIRAVDLPEPDCAPKRVRLLGEDLVAFRDSNGGAGLPAGVPLLWKKRGMRAALHLPRLEVRRRWKHRRHAGGA